MGLYGGPPDQREAALALALVYDDLFQGLTGEQLRGLVERLNDTLPRLGWRFHYPRGQVEPHEHVWCCDLCDIEWPASQDRGSET